MITRKTKMSEEQLQTLAQIRTELIDLYNSETKPDYTIIRKLDILVEDLIKKTN